MKIFMQKLSIVKIDENNIFPGEKILKIRTIWNKIRTIYG